MVAKTKMCTSNRAGNVHSIATNSNVIPTNDRHAGTAKDINRATATTRVRCHQMGISGTPQKGQASYGALFSSSLGFRSDEQFGQGGWATF
jgi:hypothetical protein